MRLSASALVLALAAGLFLATPGSAQDVPEPDLLAIGEMAPDFALTGATRYGVLQDPVRLSDFRGEVVVLAFFFRVRTRG
jgi:thioredoxin-dependent peroxiredoxin